MQVVREKVTALTAFIVCGGLANIFLVLALVLTWKYWRQVKWYILPLVIANWLELGFRFGMLLGWHQTVSWEGGSEASCKALMMMLFLGPSVANMAVAAMAVHTLLTGLTGSQGERVRHILVLGLFLLLALPLPLSQIPMYSLLPIPYSEDHTMQCVAFKFFESTEQYFYFQVGHAVAVVYFPLLVFLVCAGVSAVLVATARKGNVKGDEHPSDLIITGILGVVMLVCCVPAYTYFLSQRGHSGGLRHHQILNGLFYWEHCRNILSALLTAGFSFLYVYRKRGKNHLAPTTSDAANGEQQKLVN